MIERVSDTYHLLHIIILLLFVAIVFLKEINTTWFYKFVKLAWSSDYLKLINSTPKRDTNFTVAMLVISSVILAISYQLYFNKLLESQIQFNLKSSAIALVFILAFLSLKFVLQKFIGYIFNIQHLVGEFLDLKYSFYYYSSFVMFIPLLLLIYTKISLFAMGLIYLSIAIFFVFKIGGYLAKIRSLIIRHLFYFILYICTFEIIPILFVISYFK